MPFVTIGASPERYERGGTPSNTSRTVRLFSNPALPEILWGFSDDLHNLTGKRAFAVDSATGQLRLVETVARTFGAEGTLLGISRAAVHVQKLICRDYHGRAATVRHMGKVKESIPLRFEVGLVAVQKKTRVDDEFIPCRPGPAATSTSLKHRLAHSPTHMHVNVRIFPSVTYRHEAAGSCVFRMRDERRLNCMVPAPKIDQEAFESLRLRVKSYKLKDSKTRRLKKSRSFEDS